MFHRLKEINVIFLVGEKWRGSQREGRGIEGRESGGEKRSERGGGSAVYNTRGSIKNKCLCPQPCEQACQRQTFSLSPSSSVSMCLHIPEKTLVRRPGRFINHPPLQQPVALCLTPLTGQRWAGQLYIEKMIPLTLYNLAWAFCLFTFIGGFFRVTFWMWKWNFYLCTPCKRSAQTLLGSGPNDNGAVRLHLRWTHTDSVL